MRTQRMSQHVPIGQNVAEIEIGFILDREHVEPAALVELAGPIRHEA